MAPSHPSLAPSPRGDPRPSRGSFRARTGLSDVETRRGSVAAFAIERLRSSPVLRVCALLAFLEYGALACFAVFGARLRPDVWNDGKSFQLAGWLALCSLGSWFCIFAWFPFLRRLQTVETAAVRASRKGDPAVWMSRVLEAFAIACVATVHVLMAWILILAVR